MNIFHVVRRAGGVAPMLLAIVLAAVAPSARAGFPEPPTPLSTEPLQPFANQMFDVIFTLDGCGDAFPGYLPDNRIVEIAGQVVRITVAHATELCFPGPPMPPSYHWNLTLPAPGTYQIELYGYYHLNDPNDPDNLFLLSSGEVTVRPGSSVIPAVIPSSDPTALVVLMVLVGGIGLLGFTTMPPGRSTL